MAEIKNSESDMSTQQKAEQDWFNIAAVNWDSKAFLKDIHLTNYRFTFSYDGTRYHGWENKKNADTVEGRIESICFFKFYAALNRFSISHILMKSQ